MTSFSPTRLRSRSFLNNPPGYSQDVPGHSILLNSSDQEREQAQQGQGQRLRQPSPNPSSSASSSRSLSQGYAGSDTGKPASVAGSGTVSFAPLPVIPPELKRRSSITLGVAARKNLLSSPEDEIYPDPRRAGGQGGGGGRGGKSNGGVKAVYMNDQDWEEYKRQHDVKNGNDVVDIGELVTNQAKNLWRRVKITGTSPSPTTSTSGNLPPTPGSGSNSKTGSSPNPSPSPSSGGGILSALTSPRMSMRRRSDPGAPPGGPKDTATAGKVPDLPDVEEEESLSRYQSAEYKEETQHHELVSVSLPTATHLGDVNQDETKPRYVAVDTDTEQEVEVKAPSSQSAHTHEHGPPSPPPRVQDVIPSEDEIHEGHERKIEGTLHEYPEEEEKLDEENDDGYKGGVGTLGLENVGIRSEAGYDQSHTAPQPSQQVQAPQHTHPPSQSQQQGQGAGHWRGRDTDVLGFDRTRFEASLSH